MKLLSLYASATNLEPHDQWLFETFYPLVPQKYITIHASSGMAAKNYPYYVEVVLLISRILESQGIKIIQLGGKDDPALPHCEHLQGKTNLHQSSFILRNSLLHVGNDSWLAHRAGELDIPLITLFGPTTSKNHSAYRYNREKTVFIESHRGGRNPTFASQENPLSIGLIPPEQVANSVLRLLGIGDQFAHQTRYVGLIYQALVMDLILDDNSFPDASFNPQVPMNVRMDLSHNEETLKKLLGTGRAVNIYTKKAIDLNVLNAHRTQILSLNYELSARDEADQPSLQYVTTLKAVCPRHIFFTRESDQELINQLRFKYFDYTFVQGASDTTKTDYIGAALTYLNRPVNDENKLDLEREIGHNGGVLRFKSNKYVLAGGKAYISHAHLAANKPIAALSDNTGNVIDTPEFWRDVNHHMYQWTPSS